jgi:hypothetical protein
VRQYWIAPLPPVHTADGAAYANATALTDVGPTPQVLLPAGILEAGSRLEFLAFGRFSNTGTPTLNLGIYSGTIAQAIGSAVALVTSGAVTTITAATNRTWRLQGHLHVRSVGASGTILGVGELANVSSGGRDMMPATAPATATVDTTVARYLTVGATWGTANASNTLTVHGVEFRLTN